MNAETVAAAIGTVVTGVSAGITIGLFLWKKLKPAINALSKEMRGDGDEGEEEESGREPSSAELSAEGGSITGSRTLSLGMKVSKALGMLHRLEGEMEQLKQAIGADYSRLETGIRDLRGLVMKLHSRTRNLERRTGVIPRSMDLFPKEKLDNDGDAGDERA